MKLSVAFFTAIIASVTAAKQVPAQGSIKADSALGQNLLSKARNLEDVDGSQFQWVAGYSLKFQGCHTVQQWNDAAEGEEDVKVSSKGLVRFRLCPTDTCSATKAAGCTGGYGDYVIDMKTYVDAYFEVKQRTAQQACESVKDSCACENEDGEDEGEDCEYQCFMNAGMQQCIENDEAENFDVEQYMECAQLEGGDDEQAALYIGPYCSEQGGGIYLGAFSDNTCTEFADDYRGRSTFKEATGNTLPYSEESLVGMECLSCKEMENGDEEADEDAIAEQCEQIYTKAGKCEQNLPSGMTSVNNNACTYIEGIKIVRKDGILNASKSRSNPVSTAFIVIFAMAFAAMGFYVWYLRQRLGVKKDTLM